MDFRHQSNYAQIMSNLCVLDSEAGGCFLMGWDVACEVAEPWGVDSKDGGRCGAARFRTSQHASSRVFLIRSPFHNILVVSRSAVCAMCQNIQRFGVKKQCKFWEFLVARSRTHRFLPRSLFSIGCLDAVGNVWDLSGCYANADTQIHL